MQAYLMNLFDFGFTNFEINKEVLLKAKMNFEAELAIKTVDTPLGRSFV